MFGTEELEKPNDGVVEMPPEAELLTKEPVDVEFGYATKELCDDGRIPEEPVPR